MTWLSKLDPNTIMLVLTALYSVGTWAYHKVRGDKSDNFLDILKGAGKQVIAAALADPSLLGDESHVRTFATDQLWRLAALANVPRNALTETLANAVIEHTIGDILTQLRAQIDVTKRMSDLATAIQSISDTLKTVTPDKPRDDISPGSNPANP